MNPASGFNTRDKISDSSVIVVSLCRGIDSAIMLVICTRTASVSGFRYVFFIFISPFYLIITFLPFLIYNPIAGCATRRPCRS